MHEERSLLIPGRSQLGLFLFVALYDCGGIALPGAVVRGHSLPLYRAWGFPHLFTKIERILAIDNLTLEIASVFLDLMLVL